MKKIGIIIVALVALFFIGKNFIPMGGPPQKQGGMPPSVVSLTTIVEKEILNTKDYIGRVVAKDEVELVPQVSGYLQKKYFTEGQMVNRGDLLFLIEPDQYEAYVAQAKADIENSKAALNEAEKNLVRAQELVEKDYISKSEFDNKLASRDRNKAALVAAEAKLKKANYDLRNTKIVAPVSGKIGSIKITEGNLVGPNMGSLATLVRMDPVYVTYNLPADEFTKLKLQQNSTSVVKVRLELPDGTPLPVEGQQDFSDNKIDVTTGTIQMRATFPNKDSVLIPGMLVNVVVYEDAKVMKTMVPQEAVRGDVSGKYVYMVVEKPMPGPPNAPAKTMKVGIQRRLKLGREIGTNFIVEEGLKAGEEVVLKGAHKIMMPGMPVMVMPAQDTQSKKPPVPKEKAVKEEAK